MGGNAQALKLLMVRHRLTYSMTVPNPHWTASKMNSNNVPRSGDWNAYLDFSSMTWMFTEKAVRLQAEKTYVFTMYARQDTQDGATITVAYGTQANESAMINTIVSEKEITNGDYQEITMSFIPLVTDFYHLGIKGQLSSYPWYLSIDDLSITANLDNDPVTEVDESSFNSLSVYPNPAKEQVYMKGLQESTLIEVYSLSGEKLIAEKGASESTFETE